MPDTILSLDGVVFQDFEIPESINFGGSQRLVVHKLIGGNRKVDALGSDQDDIAWSGRFRGASALPRAQQIDRLRIIGKPVTLSWGGLSYTVVIADFKASYQRSYEIPYRITCTPSDAEVAPAQASQTIDSLVGGDLSGATGLLAGLSAPLATVSQALGSATSALGALGTLTGKSGSQTAGLLASITSAQAGIQGAITLGDGNVFQGASQIGSVVAGDPIGSASRLTSQISALTDLSSLVNARGLIGRVAQNVSSA